MSNRRVVPWWEEPWWVDLIRKKIERDALETRRLNPRASVSGKESE